MKTGARLPAEPRKLSRSDEKRLSPSDQKHTDPWYETHEQVTVYLTTEQNEQMLRLAEASRLRRNVVVEKLLDYALQRLVFERKKKL